MKSGIAIRVGATVSTLGDLGFSSYIFPVKHFSNRYLLKTEKPLGIALSRLALDQLRKKRGNDNSIFLAATYAFGLYLSVKREWFKV